MIRLWGAERQAEEKGADGWIGGGSRRGGVKVGPAAFACSRQVTDGVCLSRARTCAGGRFSWVLHKGAMGLPGPDVGSRTHKLS